MSEEPKETRKLSLDAPTVESRTAAYPDDVRDGTRWLADFICRRCNRDIKLLMPFVTRLKFATTDSTFSKVLRGYWKMDTSGKELDSPIIRETIFGQIIRSLKAEDLRMDRIGKIPFQETPTWFDIKYKLDEIRAAGSIAKFALIAGPTGAQKTESFKEYCRRDTSPSPVCKHSETPAKPNLTEFLDIIAIMHGHPKSGSSMARRKQIAESVNESSCLIFDNFQRMYKPKYGWDQDVFNYVQQLQDNTGCSIGLSITMDFLRTMKGAMAGGYLEQFEGRCGGAHEFLILPEYPEDSEIELFAKAYELKDAAKHLRELSQIAHRKGRIRTLLRAFQKGKLRAENRKAPFTIEHVREVVGSENLENLKDAA